MKTASSPSSNSTTPHRLVGQVAVVTGASQGIGAAIARQLAAEGARVVVNYASNQTAADQVVATILAEGGQAIAVRADISNAADVGRLFAETRRVFGRLDILVNNAGRYEFAPIEALTTEHYHRLFDLNVLGLLWATREAVQLFGTEGGSIVNISSVVSQRAIAGTAVYSATKGAVDALTRSLADELGPRRIRVNAVNPGMVESDGVRAAGLHQGDFRRQLEAQTPLGRIGQVGDIAPVVAFLASSDAAWITGETFIVAGGLR